MKNRFLLLVAMCVLAACCPRSENACPGAERTVKLSTTTSVDNTGLLKALLSPFEARTGIKVQVLAVGTGQALTLARNGDVDAVLVHDPDAEQKFMQEGFGLHRTTLMYNDFVLVGPAQDSAAVKGQPVAEAFKRIAGAKSPFVSRGDQSGTHAAELRIWRQAEIQPEGEWYLSAGQGMRLALNMANEKRAYCLTDRSTYTVAKKDLELTILVEGEEGLKNLYSFMVVNPTKHSQAKLPEAMALLGWLQSTEGRHIISDFKAEGQQLFHLPELGRGMPRPYSLPDMTDSER